MATQVTQATQATRPSWHTYFLRHAQMAAQRSTCSRRQVGAVLVVDKQIIATGYNGTPFGLKHCNEGGCPRCASDAPSFSGYDACACVHAETNAIALAAKHGIRTQGATMYVTLLPCLPCLKLLIQAGIRKVIYDEEVAALRDASPAARIYWELAALSQPQICPENIRWVTNDWDDQHTEASLA